jgi:hypothetical protein
MKMKIIKRNKQSPTENVVSFSDVSRFVHELSVSQTTNRQSYRATVYKALLLHRWFARGLPFSRKSLDFFPIEERSRFNRFINRYLDLGRCYEIDQKIYPKPAVIELLERVCRQTDISCWQTNDRFGIRIDPLILALSYRVFTRNQPNLEALSGQYVRVEMALWDAATSRHLKQPLTSTELSSRSCISKSTLSTLLDSAANQRLLVPEKDADDERVTRWVFNQHHPRNSELRSVVFSTLPVCSQPKSWEQT